VILCDIEDACREAKVYAVVAKVVVLIMSIDYHSDEDGHDEDGNDDTW